MNENRNTWKAAVAIGLMLLALVAGMTLAFAESKVLADRKVLADSSKVLGRATFAGGCFWCMEEAFEDVSGVKSVASGFTGGKTVNPSYEQVSAGGTGHAEAIEIVYDPARISYADLLRIYWRNIDPTTPNRQFCDVGEQYRAAIFYHDAEQKKLAEESLKEVEKTKPFKDPVVTQIVPAGAFYMAEAYHQDFYRENPIKYKYYKYRCGRAQRLEELWGPKAH
jgi:peptide-methionine (S)-S-oxide reductase